MEQVLTRQQADLAARERRLIMQVRDALAAVDGARPDLDRLARLVTEMDELFLLVVAGEYNAGKSTFINALLGDEVFAMGDLPTTRAISILRHGTSGTPQSLSQSSQPRSAPGWSSRLTAARMMAARAHGRSDSIASCETP